MSAQMICLLLIVGHLCGTVYMQNTILPVSTLPPPGTCQKITEVNMCVNIGWNASFPNLREHQTQKDANSEVSGFYLLVSTKCSNALVHLLCAIYAPVCTYDPGSDPPRFITLKPCKELCTYVRSTCEPIMLQHNFLWPPHLECDNFPSNSSQVMSADETCVNIRNLESLRIPPIPDLLIETPDPTTVIGLTPTTSPSPTPLTCPLGQSLLLNNHALANTSYEFAGIPNCGINCEGIYFSKDERNIVAPVFILICALICIGFTLFTVGTFLIDRQRYHYPERPVIFLGLCYLILSLTFVVAAIVKLRDPKGSYACSDTPDDVSYIFQRLPNATPTYHSASCVILFIFIYYFQMSAAIWWVILTLTWFMASTLKWGEEAVERPWVLYHIFAWCIPAIQVILVLALQLVDGDQLSGICYTGNYHSIGLGVFVFLPLLIFLLLGIVFLVIGFASLVQIHLQISQDPSKSRRLQRLIIRIIVYALLYIVPNVIYLCLCLYELAQRQYWEISYIKCEVNEACPGPQFVALLMRYLMLFIIGIFSTFWVISWKTLLAWKKFFTSIFCCNKKKPDYQLPAQKKTETAI